VGITGDRGAYDAVDSCDGLYGCWDLGGEERKLDRSGD
jgi:hypothetical protein